MVHHNDQKQKNMEDQAKIVTWLKSHVVLLFANSGLLAVPAALILARFFILANFLTFLSFVLAGILKLSDTWVISR